jgi:hypothetical protein
MRLSDPGRGPAWAEEGRALSGGFDGGWIDPSTQLPDWDIHAWMGDETRHVAGGGRDGNPDRQDRLCLLQCTNATRRE